MNNGWFGGAPAPTPQNPARERAGQKSAISAASLSQAPEKGVDCKIPVKISIKHECDLSCQTSQQRNLLNAVCV